MKISVRLVLSVAAVLSMVIMLTFSPQLTTDVTLSRIRLIWRPVASWLRPPYLYLVINCIIITIFASSRLHEPHRDYSEPVRLLPTDDQYVGEVQRELIDLPQSSTEIECAEFSQVPEDEKDSLPTTKIITCVNDVQLVDSNNANVRCSDDGTTKGANVEKWKLPRSDSFIHPKDVQLNTEGTKKWGVPKAEQKLETSLESTWKAITDGHPKPTTHHHTGGNLQNPRKMMKSEIFNQQQQESSKRDNKSRTLAKSSGWGKRRRDPSLGQDELNKRAEEFISRFKEDMRLQRKESLRQYVEMINSGAY